MSLQSEQFASYRQYEHLLLFYSGGLDTSFLLRYFTKELGLKVTTVSFNLGGSQREVAVVKERAEALGSSLHIHIDARSEFVREFCWRAVKSNAIYEGAHPLSSSLSRPLMAEIGVRLAREHDCRAIMHGSCGWQNNSARFDTAVRALAKDIAIVEPIMELNIARADSHAYLRAHGIDIGKREDNLMSSDNNLWGREIEDGVLEISDEEPAPDIYQVTADPIQAPDKPEYVTVEFAQGVPVKVNSVPCDPVTLVETLNVIGGRHGVGRYDAYEDKIIGHKMREIHESPAATMLIMAHRDLQTFTVSKRTLPVKQHMDTLWTELACFGLWHHPLRSAIEAFSDQVNTTITGTVRLKLFKGHCAAVGRQSPFAMTHQQVNQVWPADSHPERNFYDFYAFETALSRRIQS